MIKVLLYHNNPILANGIETALSESEDIMVCNQVRTEEGLWHALEKNGEPPSCLLVVLPRQDSLIPVILDRIKSHRYRLPVVIMSMFDGLEYMIQLLKAGVSGVLSYDTGSEELEEAVRKAAGGGRHVNYQMAERLAMHYVGCSAEKPHEILTRREFEIFVQLGDGHTVKEIAEKLRISPKTVSTHKMRIMKKMNLKSTADIVKYMVKM